MTDRERLIELIRKAKKNTKGANCDLEREMLFADYLLKNGVIVPPCKVGDTVWVVGMFCKFTKPGIESRKILSVQLYMNGNVQYHCKDGAFYKTDIGITIFLTREEAEKALAERKVLK